MKRCNNCNSNVMKPETLTEWVTVKGRMNLCTICAKHAIETDQVFSESDAINTWFDGDRCKVVEALARAPRWVTARFVLAMVSQCGTAAVATLCNLLEMEES